MLPTLPNRDETETTHFRKSFRKIENMVVPVGTPGVRGLTDKRLFNMHVDVQN